MKLVVLTSNGSFFGLKLLNLMKFQNITLDAVIIINQPLKYYLKQYKSVVKHTSFVQSIYFSYKRIIKSIIHKEIPKEIKSNVITDYKMLSKNVFYTKATNSSKTLKALNFIEPDILILAQTGIVKQKILKIPKLGTLNGHPAILPYYRGIDCTRWALAKNDFEHIGCSVHWVNAGVDTGRIIQRCFYQFQGDEDLDKLDERLDNLAIKELISVIHNKRYKTKGIEQKLEDGKQYHKIDIYNERKAKKNLKYYLEKNE